jgi:ATP-dependent helicase/DNAse subunit B
MVKLKPGEDPAHADNERRKDLRRKGLVLNDEAVLHAMESYEKKPQYLPFEHGPDGLAGDLASPAQLAELERFVTGQVESMIDEILSGVTAPNPINRGPSDTECKYFFIGLSQRRLQREHAAVRLRHAGGILAGT